MGGDSSEREISLLSGKAIAGALRSNGLKVVEIGEKEPVEEGIAQNPIDVAFIALHGRKGEDGGIQQFLEDREIPYTGSGVQASRLAFDKIETKKFLQKKRILTPPFKALCGKIEKDFIVESFPVVVKPSREGSSYGLTIVHTQEQLQEAIEFALSFDEKILIEDFIKGRELTVGILGGEALPPLEIRPKSGLYDYYSKYTAGATTYLVPAPIESSQTKKLKEIAEKVYFESGCRDFSRIDFMISDVGQVHVLEINTIPGFTQTSLLPKAAKAVGIEFDQLCWTILQSALKRNQVCH